MRHLGYEDTRKYGAAGAKPDAKVIKTLIRYQVKKKS
jgi:hypothetical protein